MAQWGKQDQANNSPFWGSALVRKRETEANRDALFGNTTVDVQQAGQTVGVFGVDVQEQQASSDKAHAGWVLRREGTGGRAGRVTYEVLVAGKSITGDASDDTVIPDYSIVINTQPADSSETTGSATSFTVDAETQPAGGSISYQWRVDGGVGTWSNVADAGVYSGATTATLSISDNTGLDGNNYSVVLTVSGADTVISANAALSEV